MRYVYFGRRVRGLRIHGLITEEGLINRAMGWKFARTKDLLDSIVLVPKEYWT